MRKRATKDPRFFEWVTNQPPRIDRVAAAKVWQGALDGEDGFDAWWESHVLAVASCFPIDVDSAKLVWAAATERCDKSGI